MGRSSRWIAVTVIGASAAVGAGASGEGLIDPIFPIGSNGFELGALERQSTPKRLGVRPVFVVGADATSLRWLEHHAATLRALGAIGFVVAADDSELVTRLRAASGISALFPAASGRAFGEAFDLDRYPVLIDPARGRVVQ